MRWLSQICSRMNTNFWRAASWHPLLAICSCGLPGAQLDPAKGSKGFPSSEETFQNVIKCHRKQGGQEKIVDIKQHARWHNALLHRPGVSALWSCFFCEVSKLMYELYIFRSPYTFDILFLFFELWSQKGILIVKCSQWGGRVHAYRHTHRASLTARNSALTAPTETHSAHEEHRLPDTVPPLSLIRLEVH